MENILIRLDPHLIDDVVKATGIRVKTKAVRMAIEEFLKSRKRKGLKKLSGKLKLFSHAELARMREDE